MSKGFISRKYRWLILVMIAVFMVTDYAGGHWIFGTTELVLGIILAIAYSNDKKEDVG